MSDVVGAGRFAQRQANIQRERDQELARQRWDELTERMGKHTEENKCCNTVETGHHPEEDFHLCLRAKDHKGYCMDKITGLSWKWETTDE